MSSPNPSSDAAASSTTSDTKNNLLPILLMVMSVAAFASVAWLALTKAGHVTSDATVGLVAALVPGVLGIVVASFGYLDRKQAAFERGSVRAEEERERQAVRYEDIVLKSLTYFTGGTQKRNVGISIVQGAWDRTVHLRPVFVPLLVNQAVYLLEESKQTEAQHERENLDRIMSLVITSVATEQFPQATYQRLAQSLDVRIANRSPDPSAPPSSAPPTEPSSAPPTEPSAAIGVDVAEENLREWRDSLPAAPI